MYSGLKPNIFTSLSQIISTLKNVIVGQCKIMLILTREKAEHQQIYSKIYDKIL